MVRSLETKSFKVWSVIHDLQRKLKIKEGKKKKNKRTWVCKGCCKEIGNVYSQCIGLVEVIHLNYDRGGITCRHRRLFGFSAVGMKHLTEGFWKVFKVFNFSEPPRERMCWNFWVLVFSLPSVDLFFFPFPPVFCAFWWLSLIFSISLSTFVSFLWCYLVFSSSLPCCFVSANFHP